MTGVSLREKLLEDIVALPEKKVKEVIDFVEYLKLKEDDWFINFVNERTKIARADRRAGKKFVKLEELLKKYR
jgi:hypothetical protein